ncbi:MAG: SH3 domain-containing protein [Bacilli bacterium]|nr:SH3 domain-containing protein [Bacilli bacterium]
MKKNSKLLLVLIVPFLLSFNVSAKSYNAVVTGDLVALRDKPTTAGSNKLTVLNTNYIVTVLDDNKIYDNDNKNCTAGWLKVKYNSTQGYTCSAYLKTYVETKNTTQTTTETNTVVTPAISSYDRPWNTPKKAIVGGAKFISNAYISKGQYTSYLKKYNVNPESYYGVYRHLYQANIGAPASEAIYSWRSYYNNGAIDLAFNFNIPVYENMKEKYARPDGKQDANLGKLDIVEDEKFEKKIESFPDSYKPYLRLIHKEHPSWTFTAMKTGLDFDTAAKEFKKTGSINSTNKKLVELDDDGNLVKTNEKNWYVPNIKTVRYYLDPRNWLNESYIFMFENLSYFNVNEKLVQSVLNKSSTISGVDYISNQSYASLFVEAGKEANVNAVYLASLSVQEMGSSKLNSSGVTFDYQNTTYEGLFNFFNIGAYSSAPNPLRAGLVYASGGQCSICATYGNSSNNKLKYNNQSLTIDIDTSDKYYTKEKIKTTITALNGSIKLKENTDYKVLYRNNKKVGEATVIVSGIGNYSFNILKTFNIKQQEVSNLSISLEDKVFTGKALTTNVIVKDKDTQLVEGKDYKITYKNNINVGKAKAIITGLGNYTGSITKTFKITENNINNLTIDADLSNKEYTTKEINPEVKIDGLTLNKDYKIIYKNNVNIGVASITINGIGSYKGSVTKTFKIVTKKISKTTIDVDLTSKNYNGKAKKPKVTITNNGTTLVNKVDYKVTYENNKKVGTAYVVITGIGKYKGTVKKKFYIIPKNTKITNIISKKGKFKLEWNKFTTQTMGYQIEYSLYSDFSKSKKVLITKNKSTAKTISNLKRNTKYYVRIRTYKEINGKKYYSLWSKVKSIKTK